MIMDCEVWLMILSLSVCLSVCSSVCLFIYLSVHLSVRLFIRLSVRLANLVPFHEPLLRVLLPMLVDPKALSVRKRAFMALCESALHI